MIIIKCGGASLTKLEDRKKLYEQIKSIDDKIVLVVSAFLSSPYSTKSLSSLLVNNYSYEMKQQLITLGEVISSNIICNELLNEYIDADVIFKENIGIYVNTSDKMDYIDKVNIDILLSKINKHKVVVVPGFIGINQDNLLVSLNENGSDLTATILAKELNVSEVILYKDVLGLCSIDPYKYKNYKLYKSVSYSHMNQIISHGCKLISNEALRYAKDNNIKLIVSYYLNPSYNTIVDRLSNEKVIVFSLFNNDIYIDGINNKEDVEAILINKQIQYDYILPCSSYIKIVTSFNNQDSIIDTLHNLYLKGEL